MKRHIFILIFLLSFSLKCFSFDNYYKMLGVPENATADEIKKGYRKMAMKYHPDRNAGSAVAGEIFKKVQGAYDVLSDTQKKAVFDKQLKMQPKAKPKPKTAQATASQSAKPQNTQKHTWDDFSKKPQAKPEAAKAEARPEPKAEAKTETKAETKPEPKVEPKTEPKPEVKTAEASKAVSEVETSAKPLTETKAPVKNPKLNMYEAPSCSKGFLGTVVDILI